MHFRRLAEALFPCIQVAKTLHLGILLPGWYLSLHVVHPLNCLLKGTSLEIPVLGSIQKQDVGPQPPVVIMKWSAAPRIIEFALSEVRLCGWFFVCFWKVTCPESKLIMGSHNAV